MARQRQKRSKGHSSFSKANHDTKQLKYKSDIKYNKQESGQSAMEYLMTYGWAVLLIAIIASLLYIYLGVPHVLVPSSCSFVTGAYCNDLVVGSNVTTHASMLAVFLTNTQSYPILNPKLFINVNGVNTSAQACKPNYVLPGGAIICQVQLPVQEALGAFVSGKIYLNASYCGLVSNYTPQGCASAPRQTYIGSFTSHTAPLVSTTSSITLRAGNSTQSAISSVKDPLYSTVKLLGYPTTGATVNFTATFVNGTDAVPPYSISPPITTTNTTGVALSYIYGSKVAKVNVTAGYAGYSNTITINFTPPPVYYVPITLTNSQSSATPAPFQQMIPADSDTYASYEQSGLQNVEFTTSPNAQGTVLDAWIESGASNTATNTIYWVNLPNGIGASNSVTIYMNFMPSSVMSSSGPTGEAPQLSSTYAEYDDGASVFNNYWNFAGTSTPSGINVYTSSGSVAFNNGVTIKGGTSGATGENGAATSASFSAPIIVDYYGTQSTSPRGDFFGWNMVGFSNYLSGSDPFPSASVTSTFTLIDFEGGVNGGLRTSQGGTATNGSLSTPSSNLFPNSVWTQIYTLSSYYTYQNYINNTGYITGATNSNSLPFEIEVGNNETTYAPNGMTVYWLRTRAYPPNGVMPSVSFGSVS